MKSKHFFIRRATLGAALILPTALILGCGTASDSVGSASIWNSKQVAEIGAAVVQEDLVNRAVASQAKSVVDAYNNRIDSDNYAEGQGSTGVLSTYSALAENGVRTVLAFGATQVGAITQSLNSATFEKALNYILFDGYVKSGRVLSILFKYEQAGFAAGFLAAAKAYSIDPTNAGVLVYGAVSNLNNIKGTTTSAYMGGFQEGIKFFNSKVETGPKVSIFRLGSTLSSYFVNNTRPNPSANFSGDLDIWLDDPNVDVIFPVSGPAQTETILARINSNFAATGDMPGRWANKFVIGADVDFNSLVAKEANYRQILLTTSRRNVSQIAVAALNTLYNVNLTQPVAAPEAVTNLFKGLVKNNDVNTVWGNTISGGLAESFLSLLNVDEATLTAQIGAAWAKVFTEEVLVAAAKVTNVDFDNNFSVN